jgi:presenilin-like A22 family membrane protease
VADQQSELESIFREYQRDEKNFEIENDRKNEDYKAKLFALIVKLTVASFIFLLIVITFQMLWKIRHPEYLVISDTVINVLAVGVFAELVGVVGIIAKLLWKK